MILDIAVRSDRGRRRRRNEDRAVWREIDESEPARKTWIVAVADGVGGAPRGDVAAELATQTLCAQLSASTGDAPSRLRQLFQAANLKILGAGRAAAQDKGGATTLVAALVTGDGFTWVANVGDSRAYVLRDGSLSQVSQDHSWVSEEVTNGRMTPREARVDPRRNLITRSLGAKDPPEVDVFEVGHLDAGDTLLLCSDGLYTMVEKDEIAGALASMDVELAAEKLVALANDHGGRDNIAVAVARVSEI